MASFYIFLGEQWMLISVFLVLICVFIFSEQAKAGKPLSVHELTRMLNTGEGFLVDVRDAKEYSAGHINLAINIPVGKVEERVTELDGEREKIIILVDKQGQHAATAGRKLRRAGFEVRRLRGGMSEWELQNLPLVSK